MNLRPKLQILSQALIRACEKEGFSVAVVREFRTIEEQDALYAQGRTQPGAIVTRRKGGESFHNYGVAFDIRPLTSGESEEEKIKRYKKAGEIGKKLGLEWGGDWEEFIDMPHFQYTGGYTIDDFRNNVVDWKVFDN